VTAAGWSICRAADVPDGDEWLSSAERSDQQRLFIDKRRGDWRLGRWVAKSVVASVAGVERARVSIVAAADGAPEALVDGIPTDLSLSISHREGTGLAVVGAGGTVVGGDLEVIEPRTDRFVREWFSSQEQALVAAAGADGRHDEMACLVWSAKEAAAKVLREGLRLDVRQAVVSLDPAEPVAGWQPSSVHWAGSHPDDGRRVISGWWRIDGSLVITVAADPASPPPARLDVAPLPR
jgi:4'-phosphopantetheinyl transferase EntD